MWSKDGKIQGFGQTAVVEKSKDAWSRGGECAGAVTNENVFQLRTTVCAQQHWQGPTSHDAISKHSAHFGRSNARSTF